MGKLPINWKHGALNYRYNVALGKMLDEKQYTGVSPGPYLRNSDVQWAKINTSDLPIMDFSGADLTRYSLRAGDLLVCEGGEVGRAAIWDGTIEPCFYQKALHRIRPRDSRKDKAEFLFYVFRTMAASGLFEGGEGKSTIAHLPAETLRRYTFPFPNGSEQVAIAAFLDRETRKIDALVKEQERLIALLKEKRQAVISQAVTKGLDPNVPMEYSGVEWLGEVPAHWALERLSQRCSFSNGKAHEPYIDADGDYICVTARFISTNSSEQRRCSRNISPAHKGDILMVMSDLPNGRALARAFLVQDDKSYAVNQRVCTITAQTDNPAFLTYQLDRSRMLLMHDDGVNQTHLSNDDFRKLMLLVPSLEEQAQIVAFLDRMTGLASALIVEAERAITLLRERRAALIAAAVTGKIDVREYADVPGAQAA